MANPVSIGIIGLSILIRLLAKKKKDKPEATPLTTSSQRGAMSSYLAGPNLITPVVPWVGNRFTRKEKLNTGGKGIGSGPGSDAIIFYEEGVHLLCVNTGRPRMIRRIVQNGETIAEGPFTPTTHPSGSRVTLPKGEGIMEFRWGFQDDPIDDWAGAAGRIGIQSKFPGFLRINWIEKRLGPSAVWPGIEYVTEMEPVDPTGFLDPAKAWFKGKIKKEGDAQILAVLPAALSFNNNNIIVLKGHVEDLPIFFQNTVQIDGNQIIGDGAQFVVLSTFFLKLKNVVKPNDPAVPDWAYSSDYPVTLVNVQQAPPSAIPFTFQIWSGGSNSGFPQTKPGKFFVLVEGEDAGANAAHVLAQALFDEYPSGLGLPSSRWDISSLIELELLMMDEGYKTSFLITTGGKFMEALNSLLVDIGCMVVQDSGTGLLTFRPIRPGKLKTWNLPDRAIMGKFVEIERIVSIQRPTRLTFLFRDQSLNYEERPISINDDGAIFNGRYAAADPIQIVSTVDFDSAASEALRREQEVFSGVSVANLQVGFDGRRIRPGDLVMIQSKNETFLVLEAEIPDAEAGSVLQVVSNPYAAPPSPILLTPQGQAGSGGGTAVLQPALARLIDLPDGLKTSSLPAAAALLWVRESNQATQAILYGSADGLTYQALAAESRYATGGTLLEAIPTTKVSNGAAYVAGEDLETSPLASFLGPDVDLIQDLSGTPDTFAAGQQLLIIGDEICYLERVELASQTQGRLVRLRRGMFGTPIQSHTINTPFFVFRPLDWSEVVNPGLIAPTKTLTYKVQVIGIGTAQDIGAIQENTLTFA